MHGIFSVRLIALKTRLTVSRTANDSIASVVNRLLINHYFGLIKWVVSSIKEKIYHTKPNKLLWLLCTFYFVELYGLYKKTCFDSG